MAAACPICAKELPDVDAVRQHSLREHGVTAAHGPGGQWTTVAAPAAASWQPDPWNAKAMRWWDGSEWSGRTRPAAPQPLASPAGESAPAPPPRLVATTVPDGWGPDGGMPELDAFAPATGASRWRRPTFAKPTFGRRRGGPGAVILAAAAAALAVVAFVVFTSGAGSPPKPDPTGGQPTLVTLGAGPAQQGLAAGLLEVPDLGAGWTPHPIGHPMPATDYTRGPCGSSLWARDIGGYQASFLNGGAATQAHGAVVNEVRQAASTSAAADQQRFISSPAFLPCLEQTAAQEAESQFPAGSGQTVGHVTANPFTLALPPNTHAAVQSTCFVLTIPVTGKGGVTQTITDDSVVMFAGPYEATLDVSWSSLAPISQQIVQLQAEALAIHLTALPPAGAA